MRLCKRLEGRLVVLRGRQGKLVSGVFGGLGSNGSFYLSEPEGDGDTCRLDRGEWEGVWTVPEVPKRDRDKHGRVRMAMWYTTPATRVAMEGFEFDDTEARAPKRSLCETTEESRAFASAFRCAECETDQCHHTYARDTDHPSGVRVMGWKM
jgi:hypothetical protein